jgi:type I restriction enzyme, S subunit
MTSIQPSDQQGIINENQPPEWQCLRIGDFASTSSGGTPSREKLEYYIGNIPWVKSGELRDNIIRQTEEWVSQEGINRSNAKMFPKGTLLVAMYGATAGKVGILGLDAATNQAICAIFPDKRVIPEYLFYALIFRRNALLKERYGGAQPNISQTVLRAFQLPIPPLSEQYSIAHILTTIRQAIEATERVIEATRQLKKSMMKHLFTYGPVPVDQVDQVLLKETEIGLVPDHWQVKRLGEVFHIQLGKMLSQASRKGKSPHKYLRNANVQWGHININDLMEMDFTPTEMDKFRLRENDILICEGGEIGRTAIWKNQISDCFYQKAIHRLRPINQNALPKFLLYYMMLIFLVKHVPIVEGASSTIAHLPVEKLKVIPFAFPTVHEQKMIADMLDCIESKIEIEENKKKTLESLFKSLLKSLMTGTLRVCDM